MGTAADRGIGEDRDLGAETLGPDEAFGEARPREVLVLETSHSLGEVQAGELLLPHVAIAGHQHGDRPALDVEHDALHRRLGRHTHLLHHQVDRHRPRRLDLGERLRIVVGHRLGGARRGGLGVREVVAVLAADEEIFADVGQRHELVVDAAADRAGIRLDDHVVQPEAVEHSLVRLVHHAVGLAHPLLVTVERVRVLHQELSCTQQPVPRPELVAVLPLHLVDVHGQVAVGRELLLHQRSRDLLLRRTEDELPTVTILQPEHQVPVSLPSTRELPRLGGQDDRHTELLGAGRVHLLAHDPFDLVHRSEPERHRGVDPRRHLPDERRSEEEPVRRDLGLGRILPERAREQLGYPHGTDKDTGGLARVGPSDVPERGDHLLPVVGRGSSDPVVDRVLPVGGHRRWIHRIA